MRPVPAHLYSFLCYAALVSPALVNRTIDDELGDSVTGVVPSYLPINSWVQGSRCKGCRITPAVDPHQPLDSTWHDTIYTPGGQERRIQARFTGSAVYVFNLIANDVPRVKTTFTNLTFFINNTLVGHYLHTPDGSSPRIQYRVPVYVNDSLPYAEHTLDIVAGGVQDSRVLFDFIAYTSRSEDGDGVAGMMSSPQSSTQSQDPLPSTTTSATQNDASSASGQSHTAILVGSIVGAVVGVIAALLTLTIGLCILRRRRGLGLPLWSRRRRNTVAQSGDLEKTPSGTMKEETSSRSSLLSFPPTPLAPSPIVSSLNNGESPGPTERSDVDNHTLPHTPSIPSLCPPSSMPHTPPRLATPPRHRADVPIPALSVADTAHLLRLDELTGQIRELEAAMRDIRGDKKGKSTESLPLDGSVSFAELRDRVQRLRALLEKEKRLMAEAFPHEKRKREEQAQEHAEQAAMQTERAEEQTEQAEDQTEQAKEGRERKGRTRGRERKLRVVS